MPKALIVEDEPEANELLAMLVQLRGYQTDSAFTGERGPGEGRHGPARHRLPRPHAPRHQRLRRLPGPQGEPGHQRHPRRHGHRPARRREPGPGVPGRGDRLRPQALHARPDLRGDGPGRRLDEQARRRGSSKGRSRSTPATTSPTFARSPAPEPPPGARTPLSEDAARGLDQLLVDLALRAVDWGCRNGSALVATLHYRWDQRRGRSSRSATNPAGSSPIPRAIPKGSAA